MRFRTKLLLACLPLALAPLAFFGLRVRAEVTDRLAAQYAARVDALADVIEEELEREATSIAERLDRLAGAMAADNRLRLALNDAGGGDRGYVLDYAGGAMRLAGLDLLRVQDSSGRVLSSGHFRNEYDVVDPALPAALAAARGRGVLVAAETAGGPILALARSHELRLGARTLTLVGGTTVDAAFLRRLARGTGLAVELRGAGAGAGAWSGGAGGAALAGAGVDDRSVAPEGGAAADGAGRHDDAGVRAVAGTLDGAGVRDGAGVPGDAAAAPLGAGFAREVVVPYFDAGVASVARFVVRASAEPLVALRGDLNRWLATVLAVAAGLALLLALVVATGVGRPLAALASKAGRVDLDRLDVAFATGRADEIGALSRVLDRMTYRLRASAARLREAERRAAVGEIARQVHHDIRNGLIPIRNVVGHLAQLARERPDTLPAVFLERQGTLESSVAYLHALAGNYARLSPKRETRACDVNAIVADVVRDLVGGQAAVGRGAAGEPVARAEAGAPVGRGGAGAAPARVAAELAPRLPRVTGDPVALRRIVENLVVNAVESLVDGAGRIVVSTRLERGGEDARVVLEVADDGRGMSADERARAFDDFYTTKSDGTGLGLSIVRRLVGDLDGRITVESEPGKGTRFTIALPAATAAATPTAGRNRSPRAD